LPHSVDHFLGQSGLLVGFRVSCFELVRSETQLNA
jgi:hypothetical protein